MDLNELAKKYLTQDQKHIKKRSKSDPINSKDELFDILKVWKIINQEPNCQIGNGDTGNTPWIFVKLQEKVYYMNSDTKRVGIQQFYSNKNNLWKLIPNNNDVVNLVTNSSDETSIVGLYFYRQN